MEKSIYSADYAAFLDLLRASRERAGMTQIFLAEKLGATQTFVSKCERGERRLDIVELRLWCWALGIKLETFAKHFDEAVLAPKILNSPFVPSLTA